MRVVEKRGRSKVDKCRQNRRRIELSIKARVDGLVEFQIKGLAERVGASEEMRFVVD